MAITFTLRGLNETVKELHALPTTLTGEARHIVTGWGNAAIVALRQAYPFRTGALVRGVTQTVKEGGPFSIAVQVKNTAPHAYLFEIGTQARHTLGKGRSRKYKAGINRGPMPAGRVFIPTMIKIRRQMFTDLKAMLARAGLEVSGDA